MKHTSFKICWSADLFGHAAVSGSLGGMIHAAARKTKITVPAF